MPDQEKDKEKDKVTPIAPASELPAKPHPESEDSQFFFGEHLVGLDPTELQGNLIVIEGLDGSGRSTQIALLQEWLESEGFAVQTSGLRRSNLVGRDIDELLAKNAVTRLTLALMYSTDFFDQLEHRIVPALRSGAIVLADRFIFTLIARSVVRGINRDYLTGLYAMALRPISPSGSMSARKPPSLVNSRKPRPSAIGKRAAICPSLTTSIGPLSATRP